MNKLIPIKAIKHRQHCRGMASIEMVLIIPFCLLLIILLSNIGRFWHAKIDNVIDARTNAWRKSYFDTVPCSKGASDYLDAFLGVSGSAEVLRGVNIDKYVNSLGLACALLESEPKYIPLSDDILFKMAKEKPSEIEFGFLKTIQGAPVQPTNMTGISTRAWMTNDLADEKYFTLRDTHTLDISGAPNKNLFARKRLGLWERQDIPLGYDPFFVREITEGEFDTGKIDAFRDQIKEQEEYGLALAQYNKDKDTWDQCMNTSSSNGAECGSEPQPPEKPPEPDSQVIR